MNGRSAKKARREARAKAKASGTHGGLIQGENSNGNTVASGLIHSQWRGPLPPPEIFNQYPTDVQRAIIGQATAQMKHRQKIETTVIGSKVKNSTRAMDYAFWLTLALMVAGVILILNHDSVAGFFALFGGSGFHIANFFIKKWQEHNKISKDADKEHDKVMRD